MGIVAWCALSGAIAGDISVLGRGPLLPAGGVELTGATSSDLAAAQLQLGAGVGLARGLQLGASVASSPGPQTLGDPALSLAARPLVGRRADLVLSASAPVPLLGDPAASLQAAVGLGVGSRARVELGSRGSLVAQEELAASVAFPMSLLVQPHPQLFAKVSAAPSVNAPSSGAATVGTTIGGDQAFFDVAVTGGASLVGGELQPSAALGVKVVVPRPAGKPHVAGNEPEGEDATASAD